MPFVISHKHSSLVVVCLAAIVSMLVSCGSGTNTASGTRPYSSTPASTTPEYQLSGEYKVNGTGANGADPYNGLLTVTNEGDAYKFMWQTSRSHHGGIGVQMGDAVAVTYADADKGKGCGVVLYKVSATDGSLEGRIAKWGETSFGSEKAIKVEGHNFDGKYKVTGTSSEGSAYEGTMEITKFSTGYVFKWHAGKDIVGFGTRQGDRAAASFGGMPCYFALFKTMSGRSLEGVWGGQKTALLGTETAKRN